MSEPTPNSQPVKNNFIRRVFTLLFRPDQFFAADSGGWRAPMLLLSLILALQTAIGGYFRARAAMMGEINLPPDWEWWSVEMQNNYLQAQQATQGTVFVYVIPLVGALVSLWLGWLVVSGVLHLASTLVGGRGTMSSALGVVAWASLPFALRDILRVIFMLIAGRAIQSPGLSGFVGGGEAGMLFASQLLQMVDLFFVWYVVLTVIGFSIKDNLGKRKAALGVVGVLVLILLAQAGLGAIWQNLGGMMTTGSAF